MRRRDFLLTTAMFVHSVQFARAQASNKKRIAVAIASTKIENLARDPVTQMFNNELRRAGLIEGENVVIDRYSAEGKSDRYESLAHEVVATNPDLIYTAGTPMT